MKKLESNTCTCACAYCAPDYNASVYCAPDFLLNSRILKQDLEIEELKKSVSALVSRIVLLESEVRDLEDQVDMDAQGD